MNRRLLIATSSLMAIVSLNLAPIAMAETGSEQASEVTSSQGATEDSSSTSGSSLKERLEKKKTELNIKLEETEKSRLKNRCTSAQGKVKSLGENVSGRVVVRQKAYAKLTEKLDSLVTKLKAKSIDTASLESQLTTLKDMIADFDADLAAYQQTITDLKDIDCEADPEAFKAALEAARSARDALVDDAIAIRDYVNNTIKETVKLIRQQLEQQEAAETQSAESSADQTEGSN